MQVGKSNRAQESRLLVTVLLVVIMLAAALLLLRVQRGFAGLALALFTAFLFVYWFRELKKMVKKEVFGDFIFEVRDEGDHFSIVAQVPGPEDEVSVEVSGKKVRIKGGRGFKRTLMLSSKATLLDKTYINGVLTVKMQKLR